MTRIHAQSPSRSAHAAARVIARRLAHSFSTSSFGSPRSLEQTVGAAPTAPSPDGYGLSALPVLAAGASELNGPEGSRIVVASLLCFAAVGAFACSLLSPLWLFAHHKWLSLNPNSGCPAQTV